MTATLTIDLESEERLIRRQLNALLLSFAHAQAARAAWQRRHWEALGAELGL